MTNCQLTNGNVRLRTKSLKLSCSEEDALSIVLPLVNITAYFLSIKKLNEVPSNSSIASSILNSKTRLAALISNEVCKKIDPSHLSDISVQVIPVGGYFKLSLIENTPNEKGGSDLQGYSVILQSSAKCTVFDILTSLVKKEQPEINEKDLITLALKRMRELGL